MEHIFNPERLTALREAHNLTQDDFASQLGIVKQQLSRWETGQNIPSVKTILRICNLFKIKPAYFFTLRHHRDDEENGGCNVQKNN